MKGNYRDQCDATRRAFSLLIPEGSAIVRKETPQLREIGRLLYGLLSQAEKTLKCAKCNHLTRALKEKADKLSAAEKRHLKEIDALQTDLKQLRDEVKEKSKQA